jgi:hypothetical protein
MILTTEYQMIGTTTANKMPAHGGVGEFGAFYTELYAKTSPNEISGIHTVTIRLMLCSTVINSPFYEYVTRYNGTVNGVSAFSGTNKPWYPWTEKSSEGHNATTISEGSVDVDCSDGNEMNISITSEWQFKAMPAAYTPQWDALARIETNATLPSIERGAKIGEITSDNGCVDGVISYPITPTINNTKVRESVYANGEYLYSADVGIIDEEIVREITLADYLKLIYEANTTTRDIEIKVIIESYNNDTKTGVSESQTTLLIPDNEDTRPTLIISLSPKYITGVDFGGNIGNNNPIVAGKTYLQITVAAVCKYGATLQEKIIKLDGRDYDGSVIETEGTKVLQLQVTDSRGISNPMSPRKINVYGYRPPYIVPGDGETEIICYRCDDSGQYNEKGQHLKLKFKRQYSDIPNNSCGVSYRIREEGGVIGDLTSINPPTMSNVESDSGAIIYNIFPDPNKGYFIQFQTIDGGNEPTLKTVPIPAEWVDYQYNGELKSWAFGEKAPANRPKSFSSGLPVYLDGGIGAIPIYEGGIIQEGDGVAEVDLKISIDDILKHTLYLICFSIDGVSAYPAIGARTPAEPNSIVFFMPSGGDTKTHKITIDPNAGTIISGVSYDITAIYTLL